MSAAAAGPSDGSRRTESFDELLNNNSASNQFDGWHSHTEGTYGAQQIVGDAHLAQQLTDDAVPSDDRILEGASGGVKKHHLPPIAIVLLVLGAILVLSAAVLLTWSRIVRRREMRDAPSPMGLNYPHI